MALKDMFFNIIGRDKSGSAFASVKGNLRQVDGAAATLNDRLSRTGTKMRNIGLAGSIASAGIARLFRGSVDAYDLQARAEAKVATAIKATGGAAGFAAEELLAQASALQEVTRFGDEEILNGVTAQLLTFKNISGDAFTQAQMAALDLATVLDGDLQSASIMLGKALNDPVLGLSAMSRAGITFSEAQQDIIKNLAQTGRLGEAQKMILDELASAYGGQAEAARAAGAGIKEAWQNSFGDIKEVVGGVMVEAMKAVLPLLQSAADAFKNLSPEMQRFTVIGGALAVALPPIVAGLGLLVAGVAAIGAPIALAIAGVVGLTAGIVSFLPEIKGAVQWVGEAFKGALMAAQGAALALRDTIDTAFTAIGQMITGTIETIVTWIDGKFTAVMDRLGAKVEWVEERFAWLYDRVVGNSWVPDMVDEIGDNFGRLNSLMIDPTEAATSKVDTSFSGLWSSVSGSLAGMVTSGTASWEGFMGALLNTGKSYTNRILTEVFDQLGAGMSGIFSSFGSGAFGGGGGGGGLFGGLVSGIGSAFGGLLGFNDGGSFTVGGKAGIDRNVTAVRLSRGEEVSVTKRGQSGGAPVININIQTPNPTAFASSKAQIGAQVARAVAAGQRAA